MSARKAPKPSLTLSAEDAEWLATSLRVIEKTAARAREILAQHPETRRGTAGAKAKAAAHPGHRARSAKTESGVAGVATDPVPSFVDMMAAKTGKSEAAE